LHQLAQWNHASLTPSLLFCDMRPAIIHAAFSMFAYPYSR
jgi:hypothetical protein